MFGRHYGAKGCSGGWVDRYWRFSRDNGSMINDDYPYEAVDAACRHDGSKTVANVAYWGYLSGDVLDAKIKLQDQPLTIACGSGNSCWYGYNGGILSSEDNCPTNIDHAINLVGLGSEETERLVTTEDKYKYKCKVSFMGLCKKGRKRIWRGVVLMCCKEKLQ